MAKENAEERELVTLVNGIGSQGEGLTGAQIAGAYKAALSDFVRGKTNRAAIAEVSKLLAGASVARRQELSELHDLSSHKVKNFY